MDLAIVDFETTGIIPTQNRVIEVAILRVDRHGHICGSYETLINPMRDLGPTHIHGIMGADVENAPTFEEIAGDVLALLKDAVFVAHNASFDCRFLLTEMARCQIELPDFPVLCTMSVARQAWPGIKHRALADLCEQLNIQYTNHHTAMSDVQATYQLLEKARRALPDFEAMWTCTSTATWPNYRPSGKSWPRKRQTIVPTASFLSRLVEKVPAPDNYDPKMDGYLSLLDKALLDRVISAQEAEALIAMAKHLGLDHDLVMSAHRRYLRDLVFYAMEDQVITERESRDLYLVAELLGISEAELQGMVNAIQAGKFPTELLTQENEFAGKSVCFTGTLTCTINGERITREQAHQLARAAGMTIAEAVTSKLNYLVVADPNSQSTKARKARQDKIPILSEVAFWLKLGVVVQ